MRKILTAIVTAFLLTLAGCGNGEGDSEAADHNQADVTFAQQMIPHHQQAIEMAGLAETRAASQEVKDLAADIEAAQGPEIESMTGWLEAWGEDVPDEGMSGMGDGDMAGMMSEDDMAGLEGSSGAGFDRMFLTMMIKHHEGAIEMAQTEQADGENPDAKALAEAIQAAQTQEIETMKELLAS
jgi:uncharacterized protein (DUF305 family)